MIETIFLAVDAVFSYLGEKERRRYLDKYLELRRAIREENQKDDDNIDHAFLDNKSFELRELIIAIRADGGSKIKEPNALLDERKT